MQQPCLVGQGPGTHRLLHPGLRKVRPGLREGPGQTQSPSSWDQPTFLRPGLDGVGTLNRKPSPSLEGLSRHIAYRQWLAKGLGQQESIAQKNSKHLLPPPPHLAASASQRECWTPAKGYFLQTRARHQSSLAQLLKRENDVCGGILSTQGVVAFLLSPRLLQPAKKKKEKEKEPGEMITTNNSYFICLYSVVYSVHLLFPLLIPTSPYEIGILLSHFINKQTKAEKGCVPCSPLTVN